MRMHDLVLASFYCCSFAKYLLTSKLLSSWPEANVLKTDFFPHILLSSSPHRCLSPSPHPASPNLSFINLH